MKRYLLLRIWPVIWGTFAVCYAQLPDALPILALPDDTLKARKLGELLMQRQPGTSANAIIYNRADFPLLAREIYRIGQKFQSGRWVYIGAWYAGAGAQYLRQPDTAIFWLHRATSSITDQYLQQHPDRLAEVYSTLGSAMRDKGEFSEAIRYYYLAMPLLEQADVPTSLMLLYERIGTCYRRMENEQQAEIFTKKALILAEKYNNYLIVYNCMANLGLTYKRQKRYPEALAMLTKVAAESQQPNVVAPIEVNLGSLYLEQKKMPEAANHYTKALLLARQHGFREPHARAHIGLAETEAARHAFPAANSHLDSATAIATTYGLDWVKVDIAETRAIVADSMGNTQERIVQERMYYLLRDSLLRGSDIPAIADIVSGYERQRKEQEIALLKTRTWAGAGIGLAALVMLGLALAYFHQRNLALKRASQADAAELARIEAEIRLLESELACRDASLETASLLIASKNKILLNLRGMLNQNSVGKARSLREDLIALIQAIETDVSDTYREPGAPGAMLPASFLDRLHTLYPDLTTNQIRLCAYLRMGYSTADIARLVGLEENSVKVARSRLRKRLGMQASDSFETWFDTLGEEKPADRAQNDSM